MSVSSSLKWLGLGAYSMLCLALLLHLADADLEEGDTCYIKALRGICLRTSNCTTVAASIERRILTKHDIPNCGYTVHEEMICCPVLTGTPPTLPGKQKSILPPVVANITGSRSASTERAAVRACRELEESEGIPAVPHILEGEEAFGGEYPHMAAIAFPSASKPYEFKCGGSLIASNFVLTAAHCIFKNESQPSFVRLGAIDIENPDKNSVDIFVNETFLHRNYSWLETYNDIGLVKLTTHAPVSAFIKPICLHTAADAEPAVPLYYVMGWGIANTTNRYVPAILLKAVIEVVPLVRCNITFAEEGAFGAGPLSRGIVEAQLCAQSPSLTDITCKGDSGGPLVLILDPALNKMRVVGIISNGFECGGLIPGIYTRVAAHLDFIESIVWPDL